MMQHAQLTTLDEVINLAQYPLDDPDFRARCKQELDDDGALVMRNFLRPAVLQAVRAEGEANRHLAYYTSSKHNIYLSPADASLPSSHPRNREIASSKGCITTDQIPPESALHTLYEDAAFKSYLGEVLGEAGLYEYTDSLSSINLHYADEGQELGWHFDNSSFAITLMIQCPADGGVFEYVKDVRDADAGQMNYAEAEQVLDGKMPAQTLTIDAGTLVLFRGRNSMHRVTPVIGSRTRMLVVLAYNTEPGVALSESARMTFFGRLG